VGDAGTVVGTEETESRKLKFRMRKRKRNFWYKGIRGRAMIKLGLRTRYRKAVADKRGRMAATRAERMAAQKGVPKKDGDAASKKKDTNKTPKV
jgi:protein phosphatase inhibitor 2